MSVTCAVGVVVLIGSQVLTRCPPLQNVSKVLAFAKILPGRSIIFFN